MTALPKTAWWNPARRRAAVVLAAGAVVAGFGAAPAQAYEFTGIFPGGDCRAMAATSPPSKLWYGHFVGEREFGLYDRIDRRMTQGCFTSQAVCENWLYQWRSTYQLNFWEDYCVKGYPPAPRGWHPRNG